jgi:hypothetical protein
MEDYGLKEVSLLKRGSEHTSTKNFDGKFEILPYYHNAVVINSWLKHTSAFA